ncbi:hypothetical protein PIB30_016601 [Stylosanthes scabra]|uniref:Replication protein A 70 kDa DNA-binding subunit B/D first OB fold domain-containing protein n=1 Tax=Stylosanthes scabra TaxID=79078 RepID=A0ABU6T787_9FABA|nr:hypothetical protein [Stylosanthes scabra]
MAAIMGPVAMNGSVDCVADISPSKLEWNLVVVVARLYKMPNQFGGKDSYTIEMILQDEAGDRVHCSIPKGDVDVFSTLIKEHGF